ncbi:MAG: hypothetical protein ABIJ95_00980, partial [Pseudomonadota bacterium]
VEAGVKVPPYMIQILLPFNCYMRCVFCGNRIFRNCKKRGYSSELEFIYKVYFDEFSLPVPDMTEIVSFLKNDLEEVSRMARRENVHDSVLQAIDSMGAATDVISVVSLPYRFLAENRDRVAGCTLRQHMLVATYIAKTFAGIIVREGINYQLDLEHYLGVIHEAAEMGSRVLSLGGFNDMFTSPEYLDPIMKATKAAGLYGVLHTSGYVLDEELIHSMVECGWDEIDLSIHCVEPKTARSLRGPSDYFEKLDMFLERVEENKRMTGRDTPIINGVFVLNKMNYQEALPMIPWAKSHGIGRMHFSPMWLYSTGASKIRMTGREVARFKKLIRKNMGNLSGLDISHNLAELLEFSSMHVSTVLTDPPALEEMLREFETHGSGEGSPVHARDSGPLDNVCCPAPWLQVAIENRGGPKLCMNHLMSPFHSNLTTHSLREIWYGDEYRLARQDFLQGRLPIECSRYCGSYPSFYIKKLLREYQDLKTVMEHTSQLPESLRGLLSHLGRAMEGRLQRSGLLRLALLKAGFRITEPW